MPISKVHRHMTTETNQRGAALEDWHKSAQNQLMMPTGPARFETNSPRLSCILRSLLSACVLSVKAFT
jgi:hypothetical protein